VIVANRATDDGLTRYLAFPMMKDYCCVGARCSGDARKSFNHRGHRGAQGKNIYHQGHQGTRSRPVLAG